MMMAAGTYEGIIAIIIFGICMEISFAGESEEGDSIGKTAGIAIL